MEYIPGGTLKEFINYRKEKGIPIEDFEISILMKNIISAIAYLH